MSVVFKEGQVCCADCKWCISTAGGEEYPLNRADWKCHHPKNISVDLVTGNILINSFHPDFLREKGSGGCGVKGKWFEKRK